MNRLTDRVIEAIEVVECVNCTHSFEEHGGSIGPCHIVLCGCPEFIEPAGFGRLRSLLHDIRQGRTREGR
jgi:hypothetical protein